jgi:hypothetical protein
MQPSNDKHYNFTQDVASTIFEAMKTRGYVIGPGLNEKEVQAVEEAFNAPLPPDFKILLQTGIIQEEPSAKDSKTISNSYFPNWRAPAEEAKRCTDWIERAFSFDIEKSNYWHTGLFGKKPQNFEAAVQQALDVVRTWPPIFPIFAHRFICSAPHKAGNPILSIWQAGDSIYYGANLLDYMDREFKLELGVALEYPNGTAVVNPEPIPFWGKAFFEYDDK